MSLPCMNCKSPVPEHEARFFGQVFICQTCHTVAESFYNRLERELKQLLIMAHESIRVALVQSKFSLAEHTPQTVSKKDILEAALRMESERDKHTKRNAWPSATISQPTESGVSMELNAPTQDAQAKSSSTKPSPQD